MKKLIFTCLIIFFIPASAPADEKVISFDELVDRSAVIIEGTIVEVKPEVNKSKVYHGLKRDIQVRINNVFKGDISVGEMIVVYSTWDINDFPHKSNLNHEILHDLLPRNLDDYILFLIPHNGGFVDVNTGGYDKFRIIEENNKKMIYSYYSHKQGVPYDDFIKAIDAAPFFLEVDVKAPQTVEEALLAFDKVLTKNGKDLFFQTASENKLVLHATMYHWLSLHWLRGRSPLNRYMEENGITYPPSMAVELVIDAYYSSTHQKDFELDKLMKQYQLKAKKIEDDIKKHYGFN